MNITVSQEQAKVLVTILQPHGELDASNYQDLIAEAQRAYEQGARGILLDLGSVPYVSSSGLVAIQSIAALLRGDKPPGADAGWGAFRAIDRDRDAGVQLFLKLLNPQPRVDHVLEMVGFKRFLEIYTDLDEALASF